MICIYLFKLISHLFYLNKFKEKLYRSDETGLSVDEIKDLNRTKPQNPFGMLVLFMGAASFTFGSMYVLIPIITITLCFLTFGTFDKEKDDNPWTFYLGFCLTLIGLIMNLFGIQLQITI